MLQHVTRCQFFKRHLLHGQPQGLNLNHGLQDPGLIHDVGNPLAGTILILQVAAELYSGGGKVIHGAEAAGADIAVTQLSHGLGEHGRVTGRGDSKGHFVGLIGPHAQPYHLLDRRL